MKCLNILAALYTEPWLIIPSVHRKLCEIVDAHITGAAHAPGGIAAAFADVEATTYKAEKIGPVAIIPIKGMLGKGVGDLAKSSGATDIEDISAALDSVMADQEIKGIMLDVDSPGGATTGIPELAQKIAQASTQKPVVAFTDGVMASAAYWLSSGADSIFASQSASIGSIGVYMALVDKTRAMEMQGLRAELFKRGKYKGIGIDGIPLSDDDRGMIQERVNELYGWFTAHVRMFREDILDSTMEGQVFFAEQAKANDLIDVVGSRDVAMRELLDTIENK